MSFDFKQFSIDDRRCAMKVGTDGVLLGAWCALPVSAQVQVQVLDLGAGSGLLSLMIAQRCPQARVVGVEIDSGAAADCAENFARSPFAPSLEVVEASATDFSPPFAPDLIITNPPFFTSGALSPSAARGQARHEGEFGPRAALSISSRLLAPGGSLAMVTPADDEAELLFQAELSHLTLLRLCRVSTIVGRKPSRLLWQFMLTAPGDNASPAPEITSLAIRTPDGLYTPDYVALTAAFYLNF